MPLSGELADELLYRNGEDPPPPSLYARLTKGMVTDDEVDYISAPFERQYAHLFKDYDKPEIFFRSALRQLLTFEILSQIDIAEAESATKLSDAEGSQVEDDIAENRIGLEWLVMKVWRTNKKFLVYSFCTADCLLFWCIVSTT